MIDQHGCSVIEENPTAQLFAAFSAAVDFASSSWLRRAIRKPLKTIIYVAAPFFRICMPISARVPAQTFFLEPMTVLFPEQVSCQILYYGGTEEDVTCFLLRYLREGMTFVDVGAHIGYFTLLASTLVGSSGSVHAFEPSKSTFEILRNNTRGKANITISQKALWSQPTLTSFYDYGPKYSTANSFFEYRDLAHARYRKTKRVVSVECTTLDQYCADLGVAPTFVKIDAELSEFHILQGGEQVIEKCGPVISLEVGDFGKVAEANNSHEKISFLLERGYAAFEYRSGEIVPHRLRDQYECQNLLFVPSRLR